MATVKLRKPNAVRDVAILYCDNDISNDYNDEYFLTDLE